MIAILVQLTRQVSFRVLAVFWLLLAPSAAMSWVIDTTPTSPTNVNGLWWNASESGWGLTVSQQGSTIFATLFTYDTAGNPYWYVASNCAISGDRCTGDLFRVRGGSPPTTGWNGSALTVGKVGTLTLTFTDVNTGSMSYSIDGVSWGKSITRQVFGQVPPSTSNNYTQSAKLLGGVWTFNYTIISGFTNSYRFTSIASNPDSYGDYTAYGTDQSGDQILGGYVSRQNKWDLYDPGSIIDRYFVYTFSTNNNISGCYHQISPPGTTNLSQCYPLTGYRTGAQGLSLKIAEEVLLMEVLADEASRMKKEDVDPSVVEAYLSRYRQWR